MSILLLIFGLLLFVGLVIIHELGHFWMARRSGVEVEEFGIGFPPRAKRLKKYKGTEYTLNWLPLGGFVKLKGEHDADKSPGSYGAASLRSKIGIMVAGVFMNLVAAFALLTFVAAVGMPQIIDNQFTVKSDTKVIRQEVLINYVEPASPAEKAGLKLRDRLISFRSPAGVTELKQAEALLDATKEYAGQKITVNYERAGQAFHTSATLRSDAEVRASRRTDNPKGYLGLSPAEYSVQRSTWSAPIVAGGLIKQFTVATIGGLYNAVEGLARGNTEQATREVSGPVGIFMVMKNGSLLGFQFVLMLVAIISLTLAIMNVLPIPALDGGRLFVTLIFHALKKPLKPKTEDMIHGTGFALLMILFLLITVVDIRRFF